MIVSLTQVRKIDIMARKGASASYLVKYPQHMKQKVLIFLSVNLEISDLNSLHVILHISNILSINQIKLSACCFPLKEILRFLAAWSKKLEILNMLQWRETKPCIQHGALYVKISWNIFPFLSIWTVLFIS